MTPRFMVLNGLRLVLLLVFVLSSSRAVQALCLGALIATLMIDFVYYRREKRLEAADEDDIHVPMPPDRSRREL
jgi:hypothetical protein